MLSKLAEAFKSNPYLRSCLGCGELMPNGIIVCWDCGHKLEVEK